MKQRGFTFPVLLDDGYVTKVGVHAFPTTWFLDREPVDETHRRIRGALHRGQWRRHLRRLGQCRPVAAAVGLAPRREARGRDTKR